MWRHPFALADPLLSIRAHKDLVATQSGPGGSSVRLFTAMKGELICETRLHAPETGRLEEPAWLGSAIAFGPEAEVFYTLSNGNTVTRLTDACDDTWAWKSPDDRSDSDPNGFSHLD